jgi:hypothetical protein
MLAALMLASCEGSRLTHAPGGEDGGRKDAGSADSGVTLSDSGASDAALLTDAAIADTGAPDASAMHPPDGGRAMDAGPCPNGPDNLYCTPAGQWTGPVSDGPATAPTACVYTALSATPSPGTTRTLLPTDDLTAAYTAAQCGDTLLLAAGASYQLADGTAGKACDDNHWITIRNATGDAAIPAEGTRITPCYIGFASLPSRPAYDCANPTSALPKIITGVTDPVWSIDHVRFIGIEFARDPSYNNPAYNSIVYGFMDLRGASHVVFDRVIMHGDGVHETKRGIFLDTSTSVAVIDSYFYDFFCESNGECTDAQAISGGVGSGDMGPYKIVNCFVEAAAENILFGGDAATQSPHDIEVRRNHLFKPMSWMPGPGAVLGPTGNNILVKNLFELKNAERVWYEANLAENVWGGFSQNGHPILLTPTTQGGAAPGAHVEHVTVRFSLFRNSCVGVSLASQDGAPWQSYSLHDLVLDGINTNLHGCGTYINEIGTPGQNMSLTHVTEVTAPGGGWLNSWIIGTTPTQNIDWNNNVGPLAAQYTMWSFGVAGECNSTDVPATAWPACFPNGAFDGNVIPGGGAEQWPAGNFFPADYDAVGFVSYNGGVGGDYHLAPQSPYKGMGTDGRDPGADIDLVNAYLSCVQ